MSDPTVPRLPAGFRSGAATAAHRTEGAAGAQFGPAPVDHDTPTRTPEDSSGWYRGLITAHRARTEEPAR
ncbi:hypothetical protein ACFW1A_06135 [Kitasatospora sp. NPDC058965]|uniref:hypothetical protein n=1 Tax=Kitasatospora sp. NPDC058965 TaxID=3346682 RepID=UPI0036C49898